MTAAPPHSFQSLHSAQGQGAAVVGCKSSGKFSARRDVLTYRQHFALVWQRFLHENFDSPAHAAHVFHVDGTTAEKWWKGLNAPSGWVVGRAISDPDMRDAALNMLAGDA